MVMVAESVAEWVDRVRAEYLEMPGLSLTKWQMRRLWVIDGDTCDAVVGVLVASGFLRQSAQETFTRSDTRV
jgi:hypothetical protein